MCAFCTGVRVFDCVWMSLSEMTATHFVYYQLCILKKKKEEEEDLPLCVFSPLHALTHLRQQQMAVCHQSVDSSRIFPRKGVTAESDEGPNGCLFCHDSSPGCDEGRSTLE